MKVRALLLLALVAGASAFGGSSAAKPKGKKVVKKVKTVDVKCPAFAHLFKTCEAELSLPLTASAQVLTQIFASDEPANGGCPPIVHDATDDYTSRFDPLPRGFAYEHNFAMKLGRT